MPNQLANETSPYLQQHADNPVDWYPWGAEAFARAFGFEVAARTGSELRLRGTDPGSPCALVRPGAGSRFTAMAFAAADPRDVHRLAQHTGAAVRPLPDSLGGIAVAVFPILVPIYLLFSQKRIYGDGWPMTLLRFAIIALLYFALAVLAVAAAFAMALLLEG